MKNKTYTLADLMAADDLHPLTRWLLNAMARMKPSKEMLAAEAVIKDKALPAFRRADGGVIQVGSLLIANSAGKGYFNGQTGAWRDVKDAIKAYLQTGIATVSKEAPVATAKRPSRKAKQTKEAEPTTVDPDALNRALNLKNQGPVDTRKCWINYAALAEVNARFEENSEK